MAPWPGLPVGAGQHRVRTCGGGASAAEVVANGLELIEPAGGTGPAAAAESAQNLGQISIRTVPATIAGARRMIRIVDVPLGATGVAGYAVDVEELEEARADLTRFTRATYAICSTGFPPVSRSSVRIAV